MLHQVRIAVLSLLLSAPALAQTPCYAENDTNTYDDLTHMGGPNLTLAIQFTAPSSLTVNRMEIFTGETTGTNSLSIWSHDGSTNHPLAQLSGTASWSMSTVNSWQGADLPTSYALTAGTTYWLAWSCIQISQASVEVPSATLGQPYCGSLDGGQSWSGPFQSTTNNWKFRIYCGGGGGGGVTPYCFGDGSMPLVCPCANNGATGHGCDNSASTGGALLASTGTTSPDTLVLSSAGELPSVLSVVYQADAATPVATFGDGILCLGGSLKKLYVKHAIAGVVTAPGVGEASITQRSAALGDTIPAGGTRYYQITYRDRNPTFCASPTGSTFNVTNGLTVVW